MGLTANNLAAGNPVALRGVGAAAFSRGMAGSIAYGRAFGRGQSVPDGYNSERALRMAVTSLGYISARAPAEAVLTAELTAFGNMVGEMTAEAFLTAIGNVLSNGSATFAAVATLVADLRATGNISASMDIISRPSANDIAQEVWTFINAGGTTGSQLAAALRAARLAATLSA